MSDWIASTVYDASGALVGVTQVDIAGATAAVTALRQKGSQAIAQNAVFLSNGAPSNQQAITQVQALTRQVNGIIRLLLGQLDSTAGT